MFVKEIMSSDVEAVSPDTPLQEIARKMRDKNLGSIPVRDKVEVVGFVTERDLATKAIAEALDPATTPAREIMSKDIVFCFDDEEVSDAAHLMEEKHLYRLPVFTHDKKLAGILSISDLAQHASQELAGGVLRAVSRHLH